MRALYVHNYVVSNRRHRIPSRGVILTAVGPLLFKDGPLPLELDGHCLEVGERPQDTTNAWWCQTSTSLSSDNKTCDRPNPGESPLDADVQCTAPKQPGDLSNPKTAQVAAVGYRSAVRCWPHHVRPVVKVVMRKTVFAVAR